MTAITDAGSAEMTMLEVVWSAMALRALPRWWNRGSPGLASVTDPRRGPRRGAAALHGSVAVPHRSKRKDDSAPVRDSADLRRAPAREPDRRRGSQRHRARRVARLQRRTRRRLVRRDGGRVPRAGPGCGARARGGRRRRRGPGRAVLTDALRVDVARLRDLVRRSRERVDLRDVVRGADRVDPLRL